MLNETRAENASYTTRFSRRYNIIKERGIPFVTPLPMDVKYTMTRLSHQPAIISLNGDLAHV